MLNEKDLTKDNLSSQRLYDFRNTGDIEEVKALLIRGVNLKTVYRQAWGTDIKRLCIRKSDGKVCERVNTLTQELAKAFSSGIVVIAKDQGLPNLWDDSVREYA